MKRLFRWIFKYELRALGRYGTESAKINLELKHSLERNTYLMNENIKRGKEFDIKLEKLNNALGNIDVSVDVNEYSRSWAVISIQGEKTDFIRFVDLGRSDIEAIGRFMRNFDRSKFDAPPSQSRFLRINKNNF